MAFAVLGITSISDSCQLPSLAILITSVTRHQRQFEKVLDDMAPAASLAQGSFYFLVDCTQTVQRLFSC